MLSLKNPLLAAVLLLSAVPAPAGAASEPAWTAVKGDPAPAKKPALTAKEATKLLTGPNEPKDQEWYAYLVEGLPFIQRIVHGRVWESFWPAYLVSGLLVPVGGLLWGPMIFYKDVPKHPALKKARTLGWVGTAISWAGAVSFLLPLLFGWLLIIPIYGWLIFAYIFLVACFVTLWWMAVSYFFLAGMFPKMILLAYSDAYALGKWKPGAETK